MKCTSRKLQLLKHFTGGAYQLFMMLSASFAGTWAAGVTPWWWVAVTGGIGIVLQRIASQLDYWQNKSIIREELKRHELKIHKLDICDELADTK